MSTVEEVPPLRGSINVSTNITQGLRPELCRSIALTGLFYVFSTNQLLCCFDTVVLHYECRRHGTPA